MGQLDRGQRHLEGVELRRERADNSPEGIQVAVVLEQALAELGTHQLQAHGPQLGHGRQLLDRDRPLGHPLDGLEHPLLARLGQGDGDAFAAGPAHAPDAVHVRLRRAGHVVVHHVRELVDVETAGGHVGGHEQVDGPAAQPGHDPVALLLVHSAVQRLGPVATAVQGLGELVHLVPGPAEDDRGRWPLQVEHATESGGLVPARHEVGRLPHQQSVG